MKDYKYRRYLILTALSENPMTWCQIKEYILSKGYALEYYTIRDDLMTLRHEKKVQMIGRTPSCHNSGKGKDIYSLIGEITIEKIEQKNTVFEFGKRPESNILAKWMGYK